MNEQLQSIEVVSLFVQDLAATRTFYAAVFGTDVAYEDEHCSVLKFGSLMVNLLVSTEAPMLVEPVPVMKASAGAQMLFTIKVDDVDAVLRDLRAVGVALINGPIDRPWGRRTAAFADPNGFVWEIAQDLPAGHS